jgi:hypothetical protein
MSKWYYENVKKVIDDRKCKLVSDSYINTTTKLTIQCLVCNVIYDQDFKSFLQSRQGCPCSGKTKWTFENVKEYIKQNSEELVSTEYINSKTLMTIKCKFCSNNYEQTFMRYTQKFYHRDCVERPKTRENVKRLKRLITYVNNICIHCNVEFTVPLSKKTKKTCSDECYRGYKDGPVYKAILKSIRSQKPRSINETYFSDLCQNKYGNVLNNVQMFEGWDADIILPQFKIAVEWNGKWHYDKIKYGRDIDAVTKKDAVKKQAIIDCGYYPYIIKDMGSAKKSFVEEQFKIFVKFLENN